MITASQIKRYRRRAGISREALADQMGVSAQTIWRWEKGHTIPEVEQRALNRIIAGDDGQRDA